MGKSMTSNAIYKRELRKKQKHIRLTTPRHGAREQVVHSLVNKIMSRVKAAAHGRATHKTRKEKYQKAHPDRVKKQNADNCKRQYKKNHNKRIIQMREYASSHKKEKAATDLAYMRKRRKEPAFRLKDTCRARIHAFLKSKGVKKTSLTAQLIGCTFKELDSKLGPRTKDDEIDHIFALNCYNDIQNQQQMAMHFSNLQMLTGNENGDKSDKLPTKAMAAKVERWAWPPGVTEDMLPDIYDGWATPLRMHAD
jgi:hypothetical protein